MKTKLLVFLVLVVGALQGKGQYKYTYPFKI
jgi:hypothetical protein